ncbi:MAG: protein kinase domain-containing protein, partial [Myxococcota bacterium]
MTSVRLGQFELDQPIGRGGMGEVWLGTFLGDGRRVAVKVITSQKVHSREYLEGFRREVRAVAGLNHPGIIRVYDYGPIPDDTAASSEGRLVADSPYFVMEYARGGSLKRAAWPSKWLAMRQMLLDILDALAHAHARGIIHRDLKPENILIDGREGHRGRLKLTDFGIAHAIEPDREDALRKSLGSSTAGTPYYMPPEQSRSDWRDYGPWTDLYALGCVAYELSTGAPPFDADHPIKIAIQHLSESPAPLQSRLPLPPGLQDWIFRLLEKQPEARFQCAADAARALLALDAPEPAASDDADTREQRHDQAVAKASRHAFDLGADALGSQTTLFGLEPPTAIMRPQQLGDEDSHSTQQLSSSAIDFERERSRPDVLPPRHTDAPSVPTDWRRKATVATDVLSGVGLGLFGLRTIPFVDRDDARDLIWQTLRDVQRDHHMRVVAITGGPGLGKSRLAEWMIERASELGAARPLKATHGPIPGPAHGLGRMVANAFSCVGMSRDDAHDRIGYRLNIETGALDEEYVELGVAPALCELALSSYRQQDEAAEQTHGLLLNSREERFEPIRHMIDILGRERPVILWLDDIQWGRESVEFVRFLQEDDDRGALPLLVLMTLQSDQLEHAEDVARSVEACVSSDSCQAIELEALPDEDHLQLVDGLLSFEPALAETVCEITAGSPLFATQLVGDWVERAVLELGDDGFRLAEAAVASIPDDIYLLWRRRIDHVLESVEAPEDLAALELAAISDREIAEDEWRRACEDAGLPFPVEAVDALLAQGLMSQTETGWA